MISAAMRVRLPYLSAIRLSRSQAQLSTSFKSVIQLRKFADTSMPWMNVRVSVYYSIFVSKGFARLLFIGINFLRLQGAMFCFDEICFVCLITIICKMCIEKRS